MKESEEKYLVQQLQEYIEAHLQEPFTIKQLADVVSYSPWYVSKVFKKVTGKSPYDDEYFGEAVGEVMDYIDKFNPELYGYTWNPQAAPRFQLAPMGYRGYIEARPVKKL